MTELRTSLRIEERKAARRIAGKLPPRSSWGTRTMARSTPARFRRQHQRVAVAAPSRLNKKCCCRLPLSNSRQAARAHEVDCWQVQRTSASPQFVTHDRKERCRSRPRRSTRGVVIERSAPRGTLDRPGTVIATSSALSPYPRYRGFMRTGVGSVALVGRLTLPSAAPVSGAAEIAFRPHTLSLAAPDSTAAPGKVWIKGNVTEREFLGEFIRYRIAVNGRTIIADQPHFGGNIEFVPGNPVSIGIEPSPVKFCV